MIGNRKLISCVNFSVSKNMPDHNIVNYSTPKSAILQISNDIYTKKASNISDTNSVNHVSVNSSSYSAYEVFSPIVSVNAGYTFMQTEAINDAFNKLRTSIISRGTQYARNSLASRRGFLAENMHAGTYNLDAAIKKINDRAVVPESNDLGSPDIVYDHGKKSASLKFYNNIKKAVKAQTNPDYANQKRIIPTDQLEEGIKVLDDMIRKNTLKGRTSAAESQKKVRDLLSDIIKGSEGAQSTPLTKEQADELAAAFGVDENGNTVVNESKIDKTFDNIGVTKKVRRAIIKNELSGLGAAVAIGLGTAFAIGFTVNLIQNGLNPESIKYAFVSNIKPGVEGGVLAGSGQIIGRTIGGSLSKKLSNFIVAKLGENIAESTVKNISLMSNMGIVGGLTTIAISVYQFAKYKIAGFSNKECLIRSSKSATLSLSVLTLSVVAQGVWGGSAGIVVSVVSGIIITGYTICKAIYEREMIDKIVLYTISLSYPDYTLNNFVAQ